jgi:hypothetical protein
MSNPWVEFVKKYAKDNNISYLCAMCKITSDPNKMGYLAEKKPKTVKPPKEAKPKVVKPKVVKPKVVKPPKPKEPNYSISIPLFDETPEASKEVKPKVVKPKVVKAPKVKAVKIKSESPKVIETPKAGPTRVVQKPKEMSNKEKENAIIDNWDDAYLGYIVDSNDEKMGHDIAHLIDTKNRRNEAVIDTYLLAFTRKYNDKIIDKYGADELMDGITRLAKHYGAEKYHSAYSDKTTNYLQIPKGYMSERNRMKMFKMHKE